MTENEALKLGKALYENITLKGNNVIPVAKYIEFVKIAIKALEEIQQYRAIGTIEEFKELKEKSVEKKAIGKRKYNEAYCPCCNEVISDGEFWALNEYIHHCNECGQAVKGVDWQ